MIRATFVLALVAGAVAASVAFAAPQASGTLNGTVGPGYTITLKQHGKLVIADKAQVHAFSLDGPHGYAKDFTTVPFVGTKTFTVKLQAGSYKYYCPPHESIMFGRFQVR